jgi:ribosomal protein L30E
MNADIINTMIRIIESEKDKEVSIKKTLIILMVLICEPSSYCKKNRPVQSVIDFCNLLLLQFEPISKLFVDGEYKISKDITVKRILSDNGKFIVVVPNIFPEKKEEYKYEYDVCISFAGEQRDIAHKIAKRLKWNNTMIKVFYDDFEKIKILGNDLYTYLFDVYSKKSRMCIILFSEEYLNKNWTRHELKAAQEKLLNEKKSCIIPIKIGAKFELPIGFKNISYFNYNEDELGEVCKEVKSRILDEKLNNYIAEDDLVQWMNEHFLFDISIYDILSKTQGNSEEKIIQTILSFIFIFLDENIMCKPNIGFLEYLLFLYPYISNAFIDNIYMIESPDYSFGRVYLNRRLYLSKSFGISITNKMKKIKKSFK